MNGARDVERGFDAIGDEGIGIAEVAGEELDDGEHGIDRDAEKRELHAGFEIDARCVVGGVGHRNATKSRFVKNVSAIVHSRQGDVP